MLYLDWNIKCFCNIKKIMELILSQTNGERSIIALQEVMPDNAAIIREELSKDFNIAYSIDYRPPGKFDTGSRKLGVMLLTSKDIGLSDPNVYERNIFPERTLCAVAEVDGRKLKIVTLHSITGCDHKMAKSVQFRTFAELVNTYNPDFVSFDANKPDIDHYNVSDMRFFSQKHNENGQAARAFFEELVNQGLRDVYAEPYDKSQYKAGQPLVVSHIISSSKKKRRYDFLFARKDIQVKKISYLYDEAVEATSDHALIIADFEII